MEQQPLVLWMEVEANASPPQYSLPVPVPVDGVKWRLVVRNLATILNKNAAADQDIILRINGVSSSSPIAPGENSGVNVAPTQNVTIAFAKANATYRKAPVLVQFVLDQ